MRRKLFTAASVLSLLLFFVTVVVWVVSYGMGIYAGRRVFREIRVGVTPFSVVFYNRQHPLGYGTAFMSDASAAARKEIDYQNPLFFFHSYAKGVGNHAGVWWTLEVPLVWPCLLTAILPSAWGWIYKRKEGGKNGLCHSCGYSLTGNTSGVCPECGNAVSANSI